MVHRPTKVHWGRGRFGLSPNLQFGSSRATYISYKCINAYRRLSMHLLWMIIVGLIVGALAKLVMPGRDPGGIIITMLLGIGGSVVAGFLGRALGWYQQGEPVGFIASVIGAVILLAIYRLIVGRTSGMGGF